MSLFFLPALISLVLKLCILAFAAKGNKVSIVVLSLIMIFALHNAIELTGYIQFLNDETVELLFRPYYVVTTYLLMYILLHGLTVSRLNNRYFTFLLMSIATALSASILFTDLVISGQYSINYSMTALEGPLYGFFTFYLFVVLLLNSVALLFGYKSATSKRESMRCIYSLLALTPVMLIAFITVIFKAFEININAAGLAPLATTLFLLLILHGERQHKLTNIRHSVTSLLTGNNSEPNQLSNIYNERDNESESLIRKLIPLSLEKETTSNFMTILDFYIKHQNKEDAFKTVQSSIEKELIYYSLKKCNYNVSKTTKMMGLKNRSTLYSMMNRLEINIKGIKKDFIA